jgi:hypothetical protein
MRIASCLFTAALLLAGCGGSGGSDTSTAQAPIVDKAAPAPGGAGGAVTGATRLTVIFTNNVDGEIEPCG